MALLKFLRGKRTVLDNLPKTDGYIYFCLDDGSGWFDYLDESGQIQRRQINEQDLKNININLNLENGEGIDSLIQKYSGEVDNTHYKNTSTGARSAVFGETNINTGDYAAVFGHNNKNSNDDALVAGKYNIDNTNALFEIGNGTGEDIINENGEVIEKNRSNAFEVYKDGRAAIYGAPVNDEDAVRKVDLETALEDYVPKIGGEIDGNVTVRGNLTVQGTTTTVNTETLKVKDNVVVANSDGVDLVDNAGFAIKTDTTSVYGIMYNPIDDGVMIGEGAIDADGKFTYIEGEAQYLATVDWTIPNGNVPQWNASKRTFENSGVNMASKADKSELPVIIRVK